MNSFFMSMVESHENYYPPKGWLNNSLEEENIILYNELIEHYSDDHIVAKIIKKDGSIINLTRRRVELLSKSLAAQINKCLDINVERQIKIFSVIAASEESLIMVLASSFLGAHHSICFEELSELAIKTRIELFKPDIILCIRNTELKVNASIANLSIPRIPLHIISINELIHSYDENRNLIGCPKVYKRESSLFTLYTSGSTGKPKAIVHSAKKYFEYAKFTTNYFFGINRESRIFTATDVGWINGHTYAIYGPLACKAQTIISEDLTKISDPNFLIKIINDLEITCLYMSVTLLRVIRGNSQDSQVLNKNYDYETSLERIGSCGEPLANEVGLWAMRFFKPKRNTIVNTFFQTETGGVLVAPRDEDGIPSNYSSVGKPRKELGLFIAKEHLSEKELQIENINPDEVLIKNPWKGLFQKVLSDRKVNYFTSQGYFRLHDVGFIDNEGFLYIGGRSDDVINTAGHRVSTSEIESICLSFPEVREACVVSIPDSVLGEKPILFISLISKYLNEFSRLTIELQELISNRLSKYHQPEEIYIFQNLPKTRSGKIIRRLMRELALNIIVEHKMDTSTLANLDDYKDSKLIFIRNKIDCLSENGFTLNLNDFTKHFSISLGSEETLYILIIVLIENLNRSKEFNHLSKLLCIIENNSSGLLNLDYEFEEGITLTKVYKDLFSSNLKNESCMIDIESAIMSFRTSDGVCINLILKKISEDSYKVNIITNHSDAKTSLRIKEVIVNLLSNNSNNQNSDESVANFGPIKNTMGEGIDAFNEIHSDTKILCCKCMTTIKEIKTQRGDNGYLASVINSSGKKEYMCDLCLQGW